MKLSKLFTIVLATALAGAPVGATPAAVQPVAAAPTTAVGVVDQVQKFYANINQVTADFQQSVHNAQFGTDKQSEGTVNHTPLYVREVVKRALELGASAIIMAHNHPTGDPSPSRDDIALTREVRNALKTVGVSLHDHIIIGRKGHCSLRSLKVIDGWN